ncbi:hypothetical protein [Mesorhizobium australicum]|uniref:hypothetical protein n=1 Tax=Mesorhizobium australicum TaxID=536018 RepID=UPI00333551B9
MPDHYKTPKAQAAIDWLLTRVKALGSERDKRMLVEVAKSLLNEMVANANAAPREEVDRLIESDLADWHGDFGLDYDDMIERASDNADAPPPPGAKEVLSDENMLSFPMPGLFRIAGFPHVLGGDEHRARAFMNDFRAMARDAWKARVAAHVGSADKQ